MSNPVEFAITKPNTWSQYAECAIEGIGPMFPEPGDTEGIERAKAVCAACPVVAECLDDAMQRGERYGIWGGLDPDERQSLRRNKLRRAHRAVSLSNADLSALDVHTAA